MFTFCCIEQTFHFDWTDWSVCLSPSTFLMILTCFLSYILAWNSCHSEVGTDLCKAHSLLFNFCLSSVICNYSCNPRFYLYRYKSDILLWSGLLDYLDIIWYDFIDIIIVGQSSRIIAVKFLSVILTKTNHGMIHSFCFWLLVT